MRVVSNKQRKVIEEFFDQMQRKARTLFERDGVCVPVAVFLYDEKQVVLPLAAIGSSKDAASMLLKLLIEKTRPLAFVMVTEAWMAKVEGRPGVGSPRDLEDSYRGTLTETSPDGTEKPKAGVVETVMLQCAAVTGESYMLTAQIVRKPEAKPTLESWERMDNRHAEGRFIFDVTPLAMRQ